MTKITVGLLLGLALFVLGCDGSDRAGGTASVTEISQASFANDPPADALVLDVRTPGEFESGHVPSARNIPHDQLASRLSELDGASDRPIVVYCKSGKRAAMAADTLLEAGYTNVLHLAGDMDGWKQSELPIETPEESLQ